jgi:hypothetical protein
VAIIVLRGIGDCVNEILILFFAWASGHGEGLPVGVVAEAARIEAGRPDSHGLQTVAPGSAALAGRFAGGGDWLLCAHGFLIIGVLAGGKLAKALGVADGVIAVDEGQAYRVKASQISAAGVAARDVAAIHCHGD